MVERGDSTRFAIEPGAIDDAARYVAETIRENHADLKVPYHSRWRHFGVGGLDRWAALAEQLKPAPPDEIARCRIDLAVTSVLLDAGAGAAWRYREPGGNGEFARSEGLAVASLHLFASGVFSAHPDHGLRADAKALKRFGELALVSGFQVDDANPLAGLTGRAGLLRRLGAAMEDAPDLFGADGARIGNLFDYFAGRAEDDRLPARELLEAVLRGLGPIWPERIRLDGVNLGDVWRHPAIAAGDATDGLVPFHKLSQWLAYSLIEPLEEAGIEITGLDELTGLAEYRNGGLFIDLGVVRPKDDAVLAEPQEIGSETVVEWRALTVVLLDRIAAPVREELGVGRDSFPLARILEGGSWHAGRKIAARLRPGGRPPIHVISDGTVM